MSGYTYGATPSTPSLTSGNPGNGTVTFYYRTTSGTTGGTEWKNMTGTSLNAGTYYMYAKVAQTATYAAGTSAAVSFTISRATNPITVSARTGLIYNGALQNLVTKANDSHGTVYFSVGTALNASNATTAGLTSIPTRKPAGSYTV